MENITEEQFFKAIETIKNYQKQVKSKAIEINKESALNLSPNEMYFTWDTYFPNMSIKLWSLLRQHFNYTSLRFIDKKTFLKTKGCGLKSWSELEEILNNRKIL